ncbi:hydroxysteroid dehydrogenase-like protein 1 [Trichonephila clavipes]|nr:hydroxysteroid dehydrogenase-like protein 1 [Trichonephila clavipes]
MFEFQRPANVFGVSDNRFPIFKLTTFPGPLRYASVKLDLVLHVHKNNSLLAELRSAALATTHERYPDQDWLHVFTDGSATASFGRAEAGDFSNSFNLKEPLSAWSDNFVDSQAAITTVSGYNLFHQNLSSSANNLRTQFFTPEERSFYNGSHPIAVFMEMNKPTNWPKRLRHCTPLSSNANKLAKAASTLHPSPCLPNAKRLLRDKFQQKRVSTLTDLAVGKSWSCLLDGQRHAQLSVLPRVEDVACFRVITGHDYLCASVLRCIGPNFTFVDENAHPHMISAVKEFLESEDICRID